ncbi:Mad3/BUB1 homology region 1-domain-containing protein [Hygrophoropsis aurantiaca]|uniref:Mad3/BUB1 homology region 1-domain-containing protein n=1 Tax=Hygrophoropsis aurantiaca TaxID=72124 RepID=A0ACB8A248_9AGAM|nr:Mad3/BUB1 homology region 1-domain-containing protein [Hygrophoropsis aurantiaca]
MASARSNQLAQERQEYRDSIKEALEEDEDPLAAYDDFVKWTVQQFGEQDPASGLIQLLEETTRKFKDDPRYKGDLRYVKLWSSYARQTEKPAIVYAYLISNEIGSMYALLYEEYAAALEKEGRRTEADKAFRSGISRSARPVERLKKRYRDFQSRPSSSKPSTTPFRPSGSTEVDALRRNPLKNYNLPSSSTASQSKPDSSSPSSSTSPPHSRYAPMLAPPVPGRRPEKLRFNLSLLFTKEGVEYSAAEVRARSMGLLGKKWGPPPASELRETASSIRVKFNDDGLISTQNMGMGKRKSLLGGGGEPTVTINTKEALADVFGMYNSPDKTVKRMMPGSKHAPVKRIEPITPMSRQPPLVHVDNNENAKTPAFKPFVDENAIRKENSTPAPKQFKPFVDEPPKQTFITPDPGRRVLSVKESAPLSTSTGPKPPSVLKSLAEEGSALGGNVFSKVFTPVSQKEPLVRPDAETKTSPPPTEVVSVFQAAPAARKDTEPTAPPAVFVPLADSKTPFKVFSRPPAESSGGAPIANVFTPKPAAFRPFVDSSTSENPPKPTRSPIDMNQIPEAYTDESSEQSDDRVEGNQNDFFSESDEQYEDGYGEGGEVALSSSEDPIDSQSDQFDEDGESGYDPPLGGRFGRINVMTPITERTFEFSTRGLPTPRDTDAVETAERLAAELREEDERERGYAHDGDESDSSFASYDKPGPALQLSGFRPHSDLAAIEERTGTLSLSDALAVVSAFKPPNPCNPFDPAIVTTLLSLLPADRDFHDLRSQEAGMLDGLQKFAQKKSRGSGASSRDDTDGYIVTLEEKKLKVMCKLGEGGFGAVFSARDISSKNLDSEDDEDLFDDEDDVEDEESSMFALKVVKPRNIWEFHVLRRIHRTLPEPLRRSVILPQSLYAFRDESFLLLQLCPQGTLLDIVNRAGPAGVSQQGACLDELLVMFFTIELLRFLEGMHSAGFIHGDLKIDNCLLRLEDVPGGASALSSIYQPSGDGGWKYKGIKVIDFGRTIDTTLFPRTQQFTADWATDARDCFEIREGRPWTYQTDYFGLAGIVYCLLFGKYIETSSVALASSPSEEIRYKISTPWKRYWQGDIWTRLFHLCLNSSLARPDASLPLCEEMKGLRQEMEIWLQSNCNRSSNTLKGLLKKIELSVFTR